MLVRCSPRREQQLLQTIHLNAAGIDIGGESHWVAVPGDRDPQPVWEFRSFTHDLAALADWLEATAQPPGTRLGPPRRSCRPRAHEPHFDIRSPLHTLCGGVDLTELPGVGPYGALKLVSEIGLDMRRWATEKHFTSWLTVAPRNQISGQDVIRSSVRCGVSALAPQATLAF